jgi:hypothetical protein
MAACGSLSHRFPVHFSEQSASESVSLGGGVYLGVSDWLPDELEPLIWFSSRQTNSTLCLPISRLSADAVRQHVAESNCKFGVLA